MTARFVSVQRAARRAERKSADMSVKNEMSETKKVERFENLDSWRREWNWIRTLSSWSILVDGTAAPPTTSGACQIADIAGGKRATKLGQGTKSLRDSPLRGGRIRGRGNRFLDRR
jgi:hypothetical protein